MVQILILLSTLLRSLSLLTKQLNHSLKNVYDILCFAPLWIEHLFENRPKYGHQKTINKKDSELNKHAKTETKQLDNSSGDDK
jgi:hypothetical protein